MTFLLSKRFLAVIFCLIWLELSVLPYIAVHFIKPDLFCLFLTFYAFQIDRKSVLGLAFFIGIFKDVLTNTFFGLETFSYVGAAVFLNFLAIQFSREKPWVQVGALFSMVLVRMFLFSLFAVVIQPAFGLSGMVIARSIAVAFYTSFFGSLLFPVLARWLRLILSGKQYELF